MRFADASAPSAFDDADDPYLPKEIPRYVVVKEQFSDGCGYGWIDG
eukprot:gene2942-5575_t